MLSRPAALFLVLSATLYPVTSLSQLSSEEDRPSVAVVLGGGGAHAIANLGLLEELERQRVPVDLVVGSGIGGVIGGLYAAGMTTAEIRDFFMSTDWGGYIQSRYTP